MRLAKALFPLLVALAVPGMAAAQKMDNPFSDAPKMYVNPAYQANANAEAAKETDAALAARMRLIGSQPSAVWMDRIAALTTLEGHLDGAIAQGAKLFLGVVYDLPGRDCAALASNGELPGTAAGLARYKTEYIDEYYRILALPKYAALRIVLVVEPDSLPNLVTNLGDPECAQMESSGIYRDGVQYAVNRLGSLPNTYLYVDAAHSGWLGWPNNFDGWVNKMNTISAGFTAGKNAIHGFVDNTANTLPMKEPFISGSMTVGGQQVMSAKFYEYNPLVDEASYSAEFYRRFTAAGWPASMGLLLDTSRNGWGGAARPTAPSTSTDVNTFVNASKVDRRAHRGLWCNPSGAGIGELPQGAPASWTAQHWDAFVWVKPPGESDGNSYEIPNDEGKRFDRMCDPTFTTQYGVLTGALPNAPLAGQWFPEQFKMLVQNIYPIPGSGPQCMGVPSSPTNLVVTSRNASQVGLSWTAASAPPNCTLTYTIHRGTTNNFTPSASTQVATGVTNTTYTVSGLVPNTTYFFMVQAVDQIGAAGSNYVQTNTENGYQLAITKSGTGSGTVTSNVGGINCGSTCSVYVGANPVQIVTLTATPATGSSFTSWTGCTPVAGTNTCTVEMNGPRTVTATFGGQSNNATLTVARSGTGTGTVTGTGINCGTTCSTIVPVGTVVTLTATPGASSSFSGWAGCSSTTNVCAVTVAANQTVTASFTGGVTNYTLTVGTAGTGSGTVTGGSINCGVACSQQSPSGTTVTLTATPAANSVFSGWSGACTGTGACIVTLTADRSVTATFTAQQTGDTPVAINGRLQRCGNKICNASGTPIQLKGMSWFWSNTGWGAERFYNGQAVQNLRTQWGATIVRAAIGVHGGGGYVSGDAGPPPNPADPTGNMTRARALIDGAIAAGVYVIVDWHSHELLQTQAVEFFRTLATQYSNVPNIIWEPFNEPTTQSWSQLKAYHTAVISAIRQAGSQNLVVVGSPTWSQDVHTATADPIADPNVAYTLHFYAGTHTQWLRDRASAVLAAGHAIMVTEWGTVDASGNGGYNPTESQRWTDWMDQNLISSANWSLHDKLESASALQPGASSTGPWPDSELTESGRWVKAYIGKNIPVPQFALSVTKSGTGTGTVTSTPAGINCGGTCSFNYNSGTVVTLTATVSPNVRFDGWSGACAGTATTCTVTMSQARSVGAAFNVITQGYALSVTRSGTGTGTVTSTPSGISCGTTCSFNYNAGTLVTLTATPASGSTFDGWAGACTNTTGNCVVTMSQAQTVDATFTSTAEQFVLTVSKVGTGAGTVVSEDGAINCGSACSASFDMGVMVTLTATPASGATFEGWSGACFGTGEVCVLAMWASQEVFASFDGGTVQEYTLTVSKSGTGTGSISGAGISCGTSCSTANATYAAGTMVTLTATPASGSSFTGWSGACTNTTGACVVTMSQAQAVSAAFTIQDTLFPLTVNKTGTGTGTVSGAGISCGTTCTTTSASYALGTVVTLTATPATGSTFTGWSGACTATTGNCVVTMSQARTVTASFTAQNQTYTLTVNKSGTGTGTVSGTGINCASTCSTATASYNSGTVVTLTATPASGATFGGWTGACTNATGNCVVTMSQARTVTATFNGGGNVPCSNATTFSWNTGNFNTTGAVCFRTTQSVRGWGCSNMAGRTVSVNGVAVSCGAGPFPLPKAADGYTYFSATAGQYPYASIYVWQ
ncbi:MAG TPA: glycoside hydrolase family 6 protein [Anaeromyxobacter sp.]|nr:glycoside hydrolase family 6 protein [Anaeromyxobacter sp.]